MCIEKLNEKSNINLNGGKVIKYLSKRYVGELTNSHYFINNKLTITPNKLKDTNDEKKGINIYVISIFDIKTMLLLIHTKKFN